MADELPNKGWPPGFNPEKMSVTVFTLPPLIFVEPVMKELGIHVESNPIEAMLCKLLELQGRIDYLEQMGGVMQPPNQRFKQPPLRHAIGTPRKPGEPRKE